MKIEQQMSELRLHGMSSSYQALSESRKHHELSLNEGLELLVQAEIQDRKNKRFERLKKAARFRYQASVEEIITNAPRGLDKDLLTNLIASDYLA